MPPERVKRQEPVSCQQCRRKKLRCDRQLPCANCQSRDTQCVYTSQRRAIDTTSQGEIQRAEWADLHHLRAENTDIKSRLHILEEIVLQRRGSFKELSSSALSGHSTVTPLQKDAPELNSALAWTSQSGLLQPIGAEDKSRTPNLSNQIFVRIVPTQEIIDQASLGAINGNHILIPTLDESRRLVRLYIERDDTLHHIIHSGSVNTIFSQLYDRIRKGQSYQLSHVALLLGITATIFKAWGRESHESFAVITSRAAVGVATYCLKGALDLLEQAWRSQSADLVTVQANIILAFLLYHTEAFSTNVRFLHANAITLAKDIGVHMTDSAMVEDDHKQSREQIIAKEMRRRVWWHLTALDWNLSLNGGPHEGTYNINPKHIRVRKPRNINDEDLAVMPADFSRPLSEATTMSYYLHCIPIGEVCREVADITWDLNFFNMDYRRYTDTVLVLDKRFDDLLHDLPPYLSMDENIREPGDTLKRIILQRHLVNLTIHARRCKLHLPFLLRATHSSHYTFSRNACLQAAQSMLKLRDCVSSSRTDSPSDKVNLRLVGILRHFFCALVVLVMDLGINRAGGQEAERKKEIQSACMIFEDARQYSTSAGIFLDALRTVMHNNKSRLQTQDLGVAQGGTSLSDSVVNGVTSLRHDMAQSELVSEPLQPTNLGFDGLWNDYLDTGSNIDPQEWDALFAQLDTTIQ